MTTQTIDLSYIYEEKINTLKSLVEGDKIELSNDRIGTFIRMKRKNFIVKVDGKLYDAPVAMFSKVVEEVATIMVTPKVEKRNTLTMNQVWDALIDGGMRTAISNEKCNYFNDIVPHKSATFICEKKQVSDVKHWIHHVGCAIRKSLEMPDGKIVMRADYVLW